MADKLLSSYPDRTLTRVLGHDASNLVGKMDVASFGGAPGGADTQVQFNDGGALGGDAGLTWDKTNNRLTVASLGSVGWTPTARFSGNATVEGGLGSINLGTPTGPFQHGEAASTEYALLQLDSANAQRGDIGNLTAHFASNKSHGVYFRTTSTGADQSGLKNPGVAANSTVFFWDFLASHEESTSVWSLNGVGSFKFAIDGTPTVSPSSLPCKFELGLNPGVQGFATRFGCYADGSNLLQSDFAYQALNTVTPVLILRKRSYLAAGLGTGVELRFEVDTNAFNVEQAATIQVVSTDITSTSEDFDIIIKSMAGGAAMAERLRINNTGLLAPASTYLNFGTTLGTSGYGIRDNAGVIQFKNSGGSWAAPGTGGGLTNFASDGTTLSGSGQTVTTSKPVLDLTQTWNGVGVLFTGIKLDITHTASSGIYEQRLLDLKVGGTSKFIVTGNGQLWADALYMPIASAIAGGAAKFESAGDGFNIITQGGSMSVWFNTGAWSFNPTTPFGWNDGSTVDVRLYRDAAGALAQRNGANAQAFRVYNTWTDATTFERGVIDWTTEANILTIGSQKGSVGGTGRGAKFVNSINANHLSLADASWGTFNYMQGALVMNAGGGTYNVFWNQGYYQVSPGLLAWTNHATNANGAATDVAIGRNAAGVLEVNNGTAGTFRDLKLRTLFGVGGTATANAPVLDLTQTWNQGGTNFTAIRLDVSPAAYADPSPLLDLKVSGVTRFAVRHRAGSYTGSIVFDPALGVMNINDGSGNVAFQSWTGGGLPHQFSIAAGANIGFNPNASVSGPNDTALTRQAAGILGMSLGGNAQSFRVYNSTNDPVSPSVYERGVFDWHTVSNVLTIGAQAAGGGTLRPVNIVGSALTFNGAAIGGGSGSPGGSTTQLQYNNAGAFGGISGSVVSGSSLTLAGDLILDPTGSNSSSPRIVGISGFSSGHYAAFRFGDNYNQISCGWGRRVLIASYHGIEIRGGHSVGGELPSAGGGGGDPSLMIYGNAGTSDILRLIASGGTNKANLGVPADKTLALIDMSVEQAFRVYKYTDHNAIPANWECGVFDWTTQTNVLTIGTQKGGSATLRPVNIVGSALTFNGSPISGGGGLAGFSSDGTTLSGSGQTVTTNKPILDLTQTWNDGAVAFTALKATITNTASAVGSKLLELNALTHFGARFQKAGGFAGNDWGLFTSHGYICSGDGNFGFYFNPNGSCQWHLWYNGASITSQNGSGVGINVNSNNNLGIGNNDSSPSGLHVHNTFTNSSNYERGVFDWTTTANILTVGFQKLGSGVARATVFGTKGDRTLAGGDVALFADSGVTWVGCNNADTTFGAHAGGNSSATLNGGGFRIRRDSFIGWATGTTDTHSTAADTAISRSAAGVVEANNGTLGTLRDFKARSFLYPDATAVPKITVSSSAPGSPATNDVWIDTT